jgi:hypothetical protein
MSGPPLYSLAKGDEATSSSGNGSLFREHYGFNVQINASREIKASFDWSIDGGF